MELHYPLREVWPYINWMYFFHAWGFPARFASIVHLHDCPSCRAQWLASFPQTERDKAQEAQHLWSDACRWFQDHENHMQAHALVHLFDANSDADDIVIHLADGERRLPMLRQQHGEPCLCWADFLPPVGSGLTDTVGLFATSVDDVASDLLGQTLADRLAEAAAERMHEVVRKQLWGYASDEQLSIEDMFQEKYVGRRPAVGYPSLPDQSINFLIDDIIDLSRIGIRLTESGAMRPHASTSGLLFRHPRARHFAIGRIGNDQLSDYARRRGLPLSDVRRFLCRLTNEQ